MAWRIKLNARNEQIPAAVRRMNSIKNSQSMTLSEEEWEKRLELRIHEDRSTFGYNYLEWVNSNV